MKLDGFYSSLVAIALPITLQNLFSTFVNMLDTIMIGRLGSIEIAAVGLGNQIFFILNMILFGIASGGGVFVAQFWGKKDFPGIRKSLGIMLTMSVIVSGIFTVLGLIIPYKLISLFSPDPQVIKVGGEYLRIVCISYIFTAVNFSYQLAFRSTERVRLPLVCTIISMATNATFNYIFIFLVGWGVKGAAVATIISRIIETCVTLIWSYSHNYEACGTIKELFHFDSGFAGKYFKIAIPVIINESFWGLGTSVYNGIYARVGTDCITAVNITNTISQLTWVFCLGFGNGMSVIIGKRIGEGNLEQAKGFAKRSIWFLPLVGVVMSVFLYPLSKLLPVFFNVSPEIIHIAQSMIFVLMIIYPFNSFDVDWVVGVCRAGGDTTFSAVAELLALWCVSIPLTMLAAFVFKLSAVQVYAATTVETFSKAIIGVIRVLSGKWLHDVTKM